MLAMQSKLGWVRIDTPGAEVHWPMWRGAVLFPRLSEQVTMLKLICFQAIRNDGGEVKLVKRTLED
jgi:hypothetical protein